MRRALAFMLCAFGALLPLRLRVLYSEALGWFAQVYHYVFRSLVTFIVKEVEKDRDEGASGEDGGHGAAGD
jgi:hypothetical protein